MFPYPCCGREGAAGRGAGCGSDVNDVNGPNHARGSHVCAHCREPQRAHGAAPFGDTHGLNAYVMSTGVALCVDPLSGRCLVAVVVA